MNNYVVRSYVGIAVKIRKPTTSRCFSSQTALNLFCHGLTTISSSCRLEGQERHSPTIENLK
jgi:hypothetical protein